MLGLNPTSMLDELGNPNLRLTFENYAPVTMERSAENRALGDVDLHPTPGRCGVYFYR